MFDVVAEALARTRTRAADIDFLIVNCSMFCPTPSLCSSVCKRFGLRSDIRSYNLGGMGCSAGIISLDLAKQLLEGRPYSKALVVSFEDITQQLYTGNKRSMLLQNTLFRVGGAAVVLSNWPIDGFRARYKLLHTVRVQDVSAAAHRCVYQCEDEAGVCGVELSKDIAAIAAKTLRDNLTILGPHVLPIREQARVLASIAARRVAAALNDAAGRLGIKRLPFSGEGGRYVRPPVYVPDFKLGLQHFCIHAGGRAVIDGIEANLKLAPYYTAPSRATLRNFGNTSSSSIWYELKYAEGGLGWRAGRRAGERRALRAMRRRPSTRAAPAPPTRARRGRRGLRPAARGERRPHGQARAARHPARLWRRLQDQLVRALAPVRARASRLAPLVAARCCGFGHRPISPDLPPLLTANPRSCRALRPPAFSV